MIIDLALQTILLAALCVLGVYNLLFAVQALCAVAPRDLPLRRPRDERPSVAVLVPAHDEESGIEKTLLCLLSQLQSRDRLVVIADNCTDSTATVAAACGAEVCVRQDTSRKGKGYALDHGLRYLSSNAPEVVVVIDADCIATSSLIEVLAWKACSTGRPVQALNLMLAPAGSGVLARVAMFAWTVKNYVRPVGFKRLGFPCQLMGTGMAFPWQLIVSASLANGELVEDMKLGLELTEAGRPPLFCPQVAVLSYFPSSTDSLKSQRYRWEHGHLGIAFGAGPLAMARALRTRNWMLLALTLDSMVPPMTLLILATTAASFACLGMFYMFGHGYLIVMALALAALMAVALGTAWWRFGRSQLSCWDLVRSVAYVFWKVPVYMHFILGRKIGWHRSARD